MELTVTSCILAQHVAFRLTDAGHTDHSTRQDSTRTVRVIHNGPPEEEAAQLESYAATLRSLGYTVTPEKATAIRPNRLRVTHP
jgi:hypothetical protein